MISMAAREARNNFGELMDMAQREPITIEKHGRPSVVVLSVTEYDQIKLERLRARLAIGEDQADKGLFVDQTAEEMLNEFKSRRHEK